MRKFGLLALSVASACSSAPRLPSSPQGAPVVEVRGELKAGPYSLGQADLEQLPRLTVRGVDPQTARSAIWEGTSVAALVSERVRLRKGADTVIIRTADRSATPIPLTVIRQLKPVLADRADGTRLATKVLAWPTEHQQGLATDPRAATWWARDVVAFELVEWQRMFAPALATPIGAVDAARRGAGIYAESCISCHRLRGVGGERGPDLTSVAARIRPGAFASLLPSHPGWHERPAADPGSEAASELWSFLRSVAVSTVGNENETEAITADLGGSPPNSP
jgi:mono/diheme cytochrome c family protein